MMPQQPVVLPGSEAAQIRELHRILQLARLRLAENGYSDVCPIMVGSSRLELPTSSVSRKRSNQLSYEPTMRESRETCVSREIRV